MSKTKQIPQYLELLKETETSLIDLKQQNDFNVILNCPPPKKWVKNHPTAKKKVNGRNVPVEYIPIEIVEYLLTRIFIKWWVQVVDYRQIANSVCVQIRLTVVHPVTGKDVHFDGLGAAPLQTDKGAGAIDWNAIKHDAVMKALPAAKSFAIKDAAHHIGNLFGRDLNRQENMDYMDLTETFTPKVFNDEPDN